MEQTPPLPLPKKPWVVKAYTALVLLVNLVILCLAWEDKSFVAIGMAIAVGPIANVVLLLLGLMATAFRKRMEWRTTLVGGVPMEIFPVLAIGLDFWIIMKMDLHGC